MSRALLVIDVQNEYFTGALPITHPAGHLEQILKVMDAATGKVPVVVIQQCPSGEGHLLLSSSNCRSESQSTRHGGAKCCWPIWACGQSVGATPASLVRPSVPSQPVPVP